MISTQSEFDLFVDVLSFMLALVVTFDQGALSRCPSVKRNWP
jgi:hypothetical protein